MTGEATATAERPRVVFIFGAYALGGAERQLARLIERRPSYVDGVDIHTITLHPTRSAAVEQHFHDQGVVHTLVSWDATSFPVFFFRLFRELRRLRPTIVHTFLDGSAGTWGRLAAFLAGVPVLLHSDRSLERTRNRSDRPLRPFLDRVTQRFLPNAHAIAERVIRDGVPSRKVTVMPNGVDCEAYSPEIVSPRRAELGIANDAVVAGFLGRIERVKRIDVLLDALLALPEVDRPDHLLVAGDGSLMGFLRQRVASDPWLAERCHLLGSVERVPEFLASLDYLVQSSEVEGLPNAVLEAMAMGLPIVATRVSDIPILIDGVGFLAEPGDVASLADAIGAMQALEPAERRRLGEAARRRIESDYDLEKVAQRFWDLHLALLERAARTRGHRRAADRVPASESRTDV